MRKVIYILSLSIVALIFSVSTSNAQCGADAQANACISKLQDGFTFLKTLRLMDREEQKQK
jgi:ABC-type cobalt transport system substrate-binding protein